MGFKALIDICFSLIKCKTITLYEKKDEIFTQIYKQSISNNFFYMRNLHEFNNFFLKNSLTENDRVNIHSLNKIKNILGIPIKKDFKIIGFVIFADKNKDFNDRDISKLNGVISLIQKKMGKIQKNVQQVEQNILAHMNHQIRTPLNGIIGYNQLLARTKLSILQENYMTSINTCCFQLLQIVNDVLDYSRLNSGKISCIEESFHLKEIFDNIKDVLKNNIQYKKQQLFLQISNGCPEFIYCDKNKLTQILINLASNAVKFTGENGTININVESRENNCLLFTVSDNGIGIAEKDQGKLFDAFTRLNENSKESQNGTGLGLAIVKKLIGLFRGEIWVSSILGQGTKFFFTIQYKPMDVQEKIIKVNQEKFAQKYVLLVDDNPDNRLILSEYLFDWKMIPIVCGSASEAFNLIIKKRYPFSLGLIDICMPITNGVQLARQIKNEFPFFPLIAISSSKDLFNNTDFEYKIDKPVNKTLLFNLILKVYERQNTKNELLLANDHFSSDEENLGKSNSTDSLELLERKDVDIFSKKILIAEDVEYNSTLFETVLKSLGYSNIDTVKNGREAIEKIQETIKNSKIKEKIGYDIIFLDLKMPEIDGYGVIEYINKMTVKIEIIVVSASVLEDERKKCKRNGVKYFISKPIDIKNIADILDLINNI
jgi:signal transduction histidine kinase/DNA-binding response OmpR family regulator